MPVFVKYLLPIIMAEQILNAIRNGLPEPEVMKELFPAFTLEKIEVDRVQIDRDEDFAVALGIAVRARMDGAPESPMRTLVRRK